MKQYAVRKLLKCEREANKGGHLLLSQMAFCKLEHNKDAASVGTANTSPLNTSMQPAYHTSHTSQQDPQKRNMKAQHVP